MVRKNKTVFIIHNKMRNLLTTIREWVEKAEVAMSTFASAKRVT